MRVTRIARIVVPFYIGALVISAPFVLGIFAYGLAHAGAGAATGLIAAIVVALLIAAVPPLALLLPSNHPSIVVLKIIGGSVLVAGTIGLLLLLNFWLVEPQWMKLRFRHAMRAAEVTALDEQPVLMQGRMIGLKITREIRLKRAIELDRYGAHVLAAMKDLFVTAVDKQAAAQSPFDAQVASTLLTFDDKPASGGFEALEQGKAKILPAGRYRTEHIVLLWGLRGRGWPQLPCRDEEVLSRSASTFEKTSGHALQAQSGSRLSLESRRGYEWYTWRAMTLRYRYEHSTWMRVARQLELETCQQRDQREQDAREEAKRIEIEQWYATGDSRLHADNNPLFREMCTNQLEAVKARLARGAPTFNLSGKLSECAIDEPNVEMFGLVMPVLYARTEERSGYCSVLRTIHSRRAVKHIERLALLRLPLICTQSEDPPSESWRKSCEVSRAPHRCIANTFSGEHVWRAGLYPADITGQLNRDPHSHVDTLGWLRVLHTARIPICKTLPDGTNLLQDVVAKFPADVVHYLVKVGCDAHVNPPLDIQGDYSVMTDSSAAVHWFMRRHGIAIIVDQYAPVDEQQGIAVEAAMGGLTAADINHADASNGRSLLHHLSPYFLERPELWRYVLSRGARLNVADKDGVSWFSTGLAQRLGSDDADLSRLFALLDQLTLAQLRELMSPRNSLTGEPGLPIEEFDFAKGRLSPYLCQRRRLEEACRS